MDNPLLSKISTDPVLSPFRYALEDIGFHIGNREYPYQFRITYEHCCSITEIMIQRFLHSYVDHVIQIYSEEPGLHRTSMEPGNRNFRRSQYYHDIEELIKYLRAYGVLDPQFYVTWVFQQWRLSNRYRDEGTTGWNGREVSLATTAGISYPSIKHFIDRGTDGVREFMALQNSGRLNLTHRSYLLL